MAPRPLFTWFIVLTLLAGSNAEIGWSTRVATFTSTVSCESPSSGGPLSVLTATPSSPSASSLPISRPEVTSHGTTTACSSIPTYAFSVFSYTVNTTNVYPTPLPSTIAGYAPTYAPSFAKASTLLPANVTYTTYSLNRSATATMDGQYGQSAYAAMWAPYTYTNIPPFTTTASATPVPSSELVKPPPLYISSPDDLCLRLPSDFIWGVAGADWQIEGGLQLEGRGVGSVDKEGNLPNLSGGNDSNVSGMNYFLYKQDIARLAAIGAPYYSFSIAWPRVVPFGVAGSPINTQALAHYDDLINTCLEYGVTPIVTLSHIDTTPFVDYDSDTLSEHFLYYAKQVMTRYGDRVPHWITFNEPNAGLNYAFKTFNGYRNQLLAHAAVYHWYKDELKGTGKITMKFANNLAVPLHQGNASDLAAAKRYQEILLGIMGNPLFLGEQFPEDVLNTPNLNLTALTEAEIKTCHGAIDYYALDAYSSQYASPPPEGLDACVSNSSHPLWPFCVTLSSRQANGWAIGGASNSFVYIQPQYVREQIGYVWNTFRPAGGIVVSEFGFPQFNDILKSLDARRYDLERTIYFQTYLQELLKAVYEDGVKLIGAIAWTFIDNNEWGSYAQMYGLQTVNMTSGNFERTYKRSFFDFVDFFHRHVDSS